MRAVSLVRYWLYGLRGFVVMTISLAIAFSFAVTGPPTDREIELASRVLNRVAAVASEEAEAVSAELCPQLPPELQRLCTQEGAVLPPKPPTPAQPPENAPSPEVAEVPSPVETAAVQPASNAQLLGAPPRQRLRPQRVEQRSRVVARRANAERRPVVRAPPQRPVVTTRTAEPAAAIRQSSDRARHEEARENDQQRDFEDWRERRREERRRRWAERAYEEAPDAYEDEPVYSDEYEDDEDWSDGAR